MHEPGQVGVAAGAGGHNGFAVQGADQVVALEGGSVFPGHLFHMAVRAGEHAGMYAARAHVGFKLGVLGLELAHAGPGIGVVREIQGFVVGVHVVGIHDRQAGIGQGGRFGVRCEVILHMALGAHRRLGRNLGEIFAHGVRQVGMGHGVPLGRVVGVAGIAAHAFVDVRQGIVERNGIRAHALLVHHMGEVRRFAGEAVGQLMGTAGFRHVGHGVEVAPCAAVVGVERHAFVDSGDHGVIGYIVGHFAVLLRSHVAFIHVRVGL